MYRIDSGKATEGSRGMRKSLRLSGRQYIILMGEFVIDTNLSTDCRPQNIDKQKKTKSEELSYQMQFFLQKSQNWEDELKIGPQEFNQEQCRDQTLTKLWETADYQDKTKQTNLMINPLSLRIVCCSDSTGKQTVNQLDNQQSHRKVQIETTLTNSWITIGSPLGMTTHSEEAGAKILLARNECGSQQRVKKCVECKKGNLTKQRKAPLHNLPIITTPLECVAMDTVDLYL